LPRLPSRRRDAAAAGREQLGRCERNRVNVIGFICTESR
jgi:hypothetical protein